jgi:hypothetical protein
VASKKRGTRAPALAEGGVGPQPDDAVKGDETVRVPQHFINGTEFKGIDIGVDYKSVLALAKALN